MIAWLAALWWVAVMAALAGSAFLALVQPRLAASRARSSAQPAVSILIPLKHDGPGLVEATASAFAQDYPELEVVLAASEAVSPAIDAAKATAQASARDWRLVRTRVSNIVNPKIANLAGALDSAHADLLFFKDAGTRLPPGGLAAMVRAMTQGVGLVSAVPVARTPASFPAEIECALINTHGARLLLAASALGAGFGIGAALLFRRTDLDRAGGIKVMDQIADDHALALALGRIGLRTVISAVTVDQDLGARRLGDVWRRHLRWAVCRRSAAPAAFAMEPLLGAFAGILAAFFGTPAFGAIPISLVIVTFVAFPAVECVLASIRGWPLSRATPFAILAREALALPLWLAALFDDGSRR